MSIGKWIFTGIGWAIGRTIGALIGYGIGKTIFDDKGKSFSFEGSGGNRYFKGEPDANLTLALLVLIAAVMKADGVVKQSELNHVKKFFRKNYDDETSLELLRKLRDLVKQDIPTKDVCRQIMDNTDYVTRFHMLDFLVGLAASDSVFSAEEERVIRNIRNGLGINVGDYLSMLERYSYSYANTSNNRESSSHSGGSRTGSSSNNYAKDPYKILGLDSSATDEDVKRAYRRFAMKYHPDKVEHLGEEMKRNAEKQFREINEAYEQIKAARGIK